MSRRALVGWVLFGLSGVVFLALGVRDGDALTIGASVLWVLGCAAFLSDGHAGPGKRSG